VILAFCRWGWNEKRRDSNIHSPIHETGSVRKNFGAVSSDNIYRFTCNDITIVDNQQGEEHIVDCISIKWYDIFFLSNTRI
jgi:hypothetical protein